MSSGWPRSVSGGNSSFLTARTKDKAETTSDAARVTWLFLAGVGSSSSKKNGLRLSTTGLSKLRYESYPESLVSPVVAGGSLCKHTKLLNVARLAYGILLELFLQFRTLVTQEVPHCRLGIMVLSCGLKGIEC